MGQQILKRDAHFAIFKSMGGFVFMKTVEWVLQNIGGLLVGTAFLRGALGLFRYRIKVAKAQCNQQRKDVEWARTHTGQRKAVND